MVAQMMLLAAKPAVLLLQNTQQYPGLTPDQQFEIAREAIRHDPASPIAFIVPLAFFAMVVLIVWFGTRRRQAQIRAQAEVRKQLIDKFGSVQELATFLESDGGRQFFGEMKSGRNPLRFLPGGIVTSMLGLAFLGLALMRRNFVVPGVLLLAVGLGLLISAAIAYKLAADKNGQGINPGSRMQPLPPA